jgi:drug/metabolite transporter (DMT)-like permease
MEWFFWALMQPALQSIVNHIDKYLLSKFFTTSGIGSLVIFSSLIGLFILPFIAIISPHVFDISLITAIVIMLVGAIYVFALIPYFHALEKDETSTVVPLFQLTPVFAFILGYVFLGEVLTANQIFGGLLIMAASIGITLQMESHKISIKKDILLLMVLSSFLFALNSMLFKYFAIADDFWLVSFWQYAGFGICGVLLLWLMPSYKKQFLSVMKQSKIPVLGLNGLNEILNIIGISCMYFATLLVPLAVAIVIDGFQPAFVFIYGVILTLFFPQFGSENLAKKNVIKKILAITFMLLGTYLLSR